MLRRPFIAAALAAALATAFALPAIAQPAGDYPNRPVTIYIGFTAGGPTDVVGRMLAEGLSRKFNQNFIVDNRAGANGGLAAQLLKKAAPDGYTLMIGSSGTLSISPNIQKNLAYDPVKDFTPIGLVANYPYFLVVPSTSPFQSYDDLVKKGREPGSDLTFASAGGGSVNHLAGEWFSHEAKIKTTHVPYKGDSAAVADIVAGRVDFAFLAGAAALPQVKVGKMRLLASASATPGRGGPGVMTIGESRIKGFAAEPWNGLMGPAGLPPEVVAKLNAAINEVMNRKDMVAQLEQLEQYPFTGTPERFATHIKEQTARWADVVKVANIKVD